MIDCSYKYPYRLLLLAFLTLGLYTYATEIHDIDNHASMAKEYYSLGFKDKALQQLRQGLKIAHSSNDLHAEAGMLNEIFRIYFYEGMTDSLSASLLERSLTIYKQLHDTVNVIKGLNNMALLAHAQGNERSASQYMEQALQLSLNRPTEHATVLQNMAELALSKGQEPEAMEWLKEACILLMDNGFTESASGTEALFMALAKRSQLEYARGQRLRARILLDSAQCLIRGIERVHRTDALAQLSQLRLSQADSLSAFRVMLEYEALMDSLSEENNATALNRLIVEFDTERLKQSNEALRLKMRSRNIAIVSGFVIALLLVIIIVGLIKKNRSDKYRNQLIQSQQQQLIVYQRQANEIRERTMSNQLEDQNRQLTSYAINHSAINEFHTAIATELKAVAHNLSTAGNVEDANTLTRCAGQCQKFDDEILAHDFKIYFEKVNPGFSQILKRNFPSLTANDVRLCVFLYLGMSTKEIASLTFKQLRSVESSRLRLRRKLGIEGDVSLQDFLRQLTEL